MRSDFTSADLELPQTFMQWCSKMNFLKTGLTREGTPPNTQDRE